MSDAPNKDTRCACTVGAPGFWPAFGITPVRTFGSNFYYKASAAGYPRDRVSAREIRVACFHAFKMPHCLSGELDDSFQPRLADTSQHRRASQGYTTDYIAIEQL